MKGQASIRLDVPSKARRQSRGQASMETLVTFGMFITFMVPVLLLVLAASQYGAENSTIYQAQSTSHLIADTVNEIYTQGCPTIYGDSFSNGASRVILVNLPGNAERLEIKTLYPATGGEVIVTVNLANGGKYDAVSPVFGRMEPNFPLPNKEFTNDVRGLKPILVTCEKSADGPVVKVSPA